MNTIEAFEHLINKNWEEQTTKFKTKYRSYKCRYQSPGSKVGLGWGKILEMLEAAGYAVQWKAPSEYEKALKWQMKIGQTATPVRVKKSKIHKTIR